ncbi:hypothetical protein [uncultured Microbulbifer sp.]|uniref:hypothetical protein n=1 Tax=uncultured Microbulbifer sp. TaxID=348147 RepID=UPI002620CEFE|nr:hypothetical protein [uncultured Microbulbifer sp.]
MRIRAWGATPVALALLSASGCGYFPSEMAIAGKEKVPPAHTRITGKPQVVSCTTPARGFPPIPFDDLYLFTSNLRRPFRENPGLPVQYDVNAYVWGGERCAPQAFCNNGDYYWLIGRGPGDDFQTWAITPHYPRMTIQSPCSEQLQVGQRYRFSFSRGQLVGFSPD